MERRLQLTKVSEPLKKGENAVVLELTDIQLHSNVRPTISVGGAIRRSIDNNQPGRIYAPLSVSPQEMSLTTLIPHDASLLKVIEEYQKQGIRVFVKLPEAGLPVHMSDDAILHMQGVKGKRKLRRMERSGK